MVFDDERKTFNTVAGARRWLKEEYGNCKRTNFYGVGGMHTGYVFGYKERDVWVDGSVKHRLRRDRVEFREIVNITPTGQRLLTR